jgi:hypothetical protein
MRLAPRDRYRRPAGTIRIGVELNLAVVRTRGAASEGWRTWLLRLPACHSGALADPGCRADLGTSGRP